MNDPLGPRDDAETLLSPEEREGIIPSNLVDVSETRLRYVAALRAADSHDIGPLLEFVRS